jgi:hypothetical protein
MSKTLRLSIIATLALASSPVILILNMSVRQAKALAPGGATAGG